MGLQDLQGLWASRVSQGSRVSLGQQDQGGNQGRLGHRDLQELLDLQGTLTHIIPASTVRSGRMILQLGLKGINEVQPQTTRNQRKPGKKKTEN